MIFCDPDYLGVVPSPPYTRVEIPGKPWTMFGAVRPVHFEFPDTTDPINCLCFSQVEIAQVIGLSPNAGKITVSTMVKNGKFPPPVWAAEWSRRNPFNNVQPKTLWGKVYTVPEAEVLHIAWRCANRDIAAIRRDLAAIREYLGETIA